MSPEFNYLLFFGFIRKYKGLDLAIEAMADERIRNLPVKLIIAGEFYEDEKIYRSLISKLKVEDRIILRNDFIAEKMSGNISPPLIYWYYHTEVQHKVASLK